MSTEQNKQLAHELFARFTASDIPGVMRLMTDDATWQLPGKPGQMPIAGLQSKAQIERVFHNMLARLRHGLRMTATSMIAEDDKVAVEAESYGELKNGRTYDQRYHLLIVFRDGKICEVREYLDTQHTFAVWFQPEDATVPATKSRTD